jgi:BolA protein
MKTATSTAAVMKVGSRMAGVKERIESKLQSGLVPDALTVTDESNQHHGHAAWRESGETHFRVSVCSARFAGKSRIDRQRLIYGILSEELAGPVHALAISARAPGEPSPDEQSPSQPASGPSS